MDNVSAVESIVRVTRIGLFLNIALFFLKLVVGLLTGSAALVADAIHTVSDLLSDFVVIVGAKISARPIDRCHDYGHGKFETVAALVVASLLVAAGFLIAAEAGFSIYDGETTDPGVAVLLVALVSIISKEWIFRLTRRVGIRLGSPSLQVNAWHHRSDSLSSVAVLLGAIAGLLGWGYGDHAAAIAVGLMIGIVGLKAAAKYINELTESTISENEREPIVRAIEGVVGVKGWHNLRTRLVGREIFMDVHVTVDPHLSVDEGHDICCAVEQAIAGSLERSANIDIVVHCEPDRGDIKMEDG